MALLTNDEMEVLKDEALDTVKVAADVIQYAGKKIIENPTKAALIIGLFTVAIGGIKRLKLSDVFEFGK